MRLYDAHLLEIKTLCKKYSVQSLFAFGSIVRGEQIPDSDADFLVEFNWQADRNFFDCYWGLKTDLEALLKRPVDLVCDSAIRNPIFRREVDAHKESIYAA
jgi:predicted nucleotidyltransferase